ncbi:UDP-N-acetylglucosamine 1-carboxyvinyltransferase [Clostridia bacterium OttesenSCG-928-F22]|nr:UDP-N-acetylglucosamine 1-carboxyvinyltransferase [Clostridia bacterium OttesenSCG-928-F22]
MIEEKLLINGQVRLQGEVEVSGAKNAAVGVIPATILCEETCVLENLPHIDDVTILKTILQGMGAKVALSPNGVMTINTASLNTHTATGRLVGHMRASYYLLGSLLGRFGKAEIALPGGCSIGQRPIDQHIKGLRALGAHTAIENGILKAWCDELIGAEVYLDVTSVGATINIMLAAIKATGTTTIVNAAKEPHVVDIANFLNCMGANVKGAGTDIIRIKGVKRLHGAPSYAIIPDQIETGTLMIAAAATKGDVLIKNVIPLHMEALSAKLMEMGVRVSEGDDTIRVTCDRRLKAVNVRTFPYPGFPTDLQQPITVLLSTAVGTSVIVENIFESRYKHIHEILRMGAKVRIDNSVAVVEGVERLSGAPVRATDLRAGAALIIAGLMAEGTTEISNIKYIDRGYEHIEEKLTHLGADIRRTKTETPNFAIY